MAENKSWLDKQRNEAEAAAKASQDEAERNTYLRGGSKYQTGHRVSEYDTAHPEYGGMRPQAAYESNRGYYNDLYESKRNPTLENYQYIDLNAVQKEYPGATLHQTDAGMEIITYQPQSSPTQEDYKQKAEAAAQNRPGYYPLSDIGDLQTQRTLKAIEQANKGLELAGLPTMNLEAAAGAILETQRQQAYSTPTIKDDMFFGNELSKWASRPVEQSSAYHHIGMEAGVPIPENPYEMRGDLAVEFLKGSPDKPSERFSPVSGIMSQYLPGGLGLQETMWNTAIASDRGRTLPGPVSYMNAVNVLSTTHGGLFTGEIGHPAQQVDMVTKTKIVGSQAVITDPVSQQGLTLNGLSVGGVSLFSPSMAQPTPNIRDYDASGVSKYYSDLSSYKTKVETYTQKVEKYEADFAVLTVGGVAVSQGAYDQLSSRKQSLDVEYNNIQLAEKQFDIEYPEERLKSIFSKVIDLNAATDKGYGVKVAPSGDISYVPLTTPKIELPKPYVSLYKESVSDYTGFSARAAIIGIPLKQGIELERLWSESNRANEKANEIYTLNSNAGHFDTSAYPAKFTGSEVDYNYLKQVSDEATAATDRYQKYYNSMFPSTRPESERNVFTNAIDATASAFSGISDAYTKHVSTPYSEYIKPLSKTESGFGVTFTGGLPMIYMKPATLSEAANAVIQTPSRLATMGSQAVKGIESVARNPGSFVPMLAAGTIMSGKSIYEGITQHPVQFVFEQIGNIAVLGGIQESVNFGYGYVRTAGLKYVKIEDIGYEPKYGYPKGPGQTVGSIKASFEKGSLYPKPTEMASGISTEVPYIPQVARLPEVNPALGADPGKYYLWTGWESGAGASRIQTNLLQPIKSIKGTVKGVTTGEITFGKGTSELYGAHAAPVLETYFTKAGVASKSRPISEFSLTGIRKPTGLYTNVNELVKIPGSTYESMNKFLQEEVAAGRTPGKAYVPLMKPEYEVVIPMGATAKNLGSRYYTKVGGFGEGHILGQRVKIIELVSSGKGTPQGLIDFNAIAQKSYESMAPEPYVNSAPLAGGLLAGSLSKSYEYPYNLQKIRSIEEYYPYKSSRISSPPISYKGTSSTASRVSSRSYGIPEASSYRPSISPEKYLYSSKGSSKKSSSSSARSGVSSLFSPVSSLVSSPAKSRSPSKPSSPKSIVSPVSSLISSPASSVASGLSSLVSPPSSLISKGYSPPSPSYSPPSYAPPPPDIPRYDITTLMGSGDLYGPGNLLLYPSRRKIKYHNPIVDVPYLIDVSENFGEVLHGKRKSKKKSLLDDFGM